VDAGFFSYFRVKHIAKGLKQNKIFQYTLLMTYSLALLLIWGVGLLQIDIANEKTVFITFIFTCYSLLYFKKEDYVSKLILLIGPGIYITATLLIKDLDGLLTFPVVWLFTLYLIVLFGSFKLISLNTIIVSYTLIYTFYIYDYPINNQLDDRNTKQDIRNDLNLLQFKFVNFNNDTISLLKNDKPFLVETWNETCKPCISSIHDMQSILSSDTSFNHIYLYQYRGEKKLQIEEIFNFKPIINKDKIIIDLDNNFYNGLELNSYPYFIIFDSQGNLVEYHNGYNSQYREEVLKNLLSSIKKAY
jgi:hypothetical protein